MEFRDAWGDADAEMEEAEVQAGDADRAGDDDTGSDAAGQDWRDAEAAAEAARGEAGEGGERIGPGWRRRVATLARWEPSAWAHMCGALGKRPHDVMRGETEDVVGD